MIVIQLKGGLGNQMFQYALALKLSTIQKNPVILDTSFYQRASGSIPRTLGIPYFNISLPLQHLPPEIFLSQKIQNKGIRYLKKILFPFHLRAYIKEPCPPQFYSSILKIRHHSYLDGYWQSYLYFHDIAALLQKEFSLKNPPSDRYRSLLNMIQENSVSIHVRRTDYLHAVNYFFHQLPLEYYQQALSLLPSASSQSFRIFIFSDDTDWCKQHLIPEAEHYYISSSDMPDYEALILMSKCRINIIANSTFSWWAAFLNTHPNKHVIAPKKWYHKTSPQFLRMLYPPLWQVL